jgi:hypothetical protein
MLLRRGRAVSRADARIRHIFLDVFGVFMDGTYSFMRAFLLE